jgi:hypothetical protein
LWWQRCSLEAFSRSKSHVILKLLPCSTTTSFQLTFRIVFAVAQGLLMLFFWGLFSIFFGVAKKWQMIKKLMKLSTHFKVFFCFRNSIRKCLFCFQMNNQ